MLTPPVTPATPMSPNGHRTTPPRRIQLSYTPNNVESFERLKDRWVDTLKESGPRGDIGSLLHAYFKKRIPLEGVGPP